MPDKKWTSASAMKEFLRREQDILIMHRMPQDMSMDVNQDLVNALPPPGGNGTGEGNPDMTGMAGQY